MCWLNKIRSLLSGQQEPQQGAKRNGWDAFNNRGMKKKQASAYLRLPSSPDAQTETGETDVMRVLVISDTHGVHKNLDRVLEKERPYDLVIHLGDIEGDEDYLEAAADCPVAAVRGNNDYFSNLPQEQLVEVAGKKILLTHGHYYYVVAGLEHLAREAQGRGVDMVMFGHIHRPVVRQEGDLTILNPGSLSYPRQEDRKPSYIVMEIQPHGELEIFLKFI